jgi:hypothetical protein
MIGKDIIKKVIEGLPKILKQDALKYGVVIGFTYLITKAFGC